MVEIHFNSKTCLCMFQRTSGAVENLWTSAFFQFIWVPFCWFSFGLSLCTVFMCTFKCFIPFLNVYLQIGHVWGVSLSGFGVLDVFFSLSFWTEMKKWSKRIIIESGVEANNLPLQLAVDCQSLTFFCVQHSCRFNLVLVRYWGLLVQPSVVCDDVFCAERCQFTILARIDYDILSMVCIIVKLLWRFSAELNIAILQYFSLPLLLPCFVFCIFFVFLFSSFVVEVSCLNTPTFWNAKKVLKFY